METTHNISNNNELVFNGFLHENLISSIILLSLSFVLTYSIIPKIISVVKLKHLMDVPNQRSSHKTTIPSLGGIAFYIVLILGLYFLNQFDKANTIVSIVPGLLVLFIIGLKDDLIALSPKSKLIAQFISSAFILSHQSFQIHNLHGFLGIYEISLYITIPASAIVIVAIINAFNLIDGIDGLASIVGMIIFAVFGILFYSINMDFYFGICLLMFGSLLAFLRFNVSVKQKIFMGDTGSLLLGFVIAILAIKLVSCSSVHLQGLTIEMENLPFLIIAILIIPLFDTARVFTIRIINKKSPFSSDRNHIHHILIDKLHFSHKKASISIGLLNILVVSLSFELSRNFNNSGMIIFLISLSIFLVVMFNRMTLPIQSMKQNIYVQNYIKFLRHVTNMF